MELKKFNCGECGFSFATDKYKYIVRRYPLYPFGDGEEGVAKVKCAKCGNEFELVLWDAS